MLALFRKNESLRIFAISGLITIGALIGVYGYLGWQAAFVTLVLIVIEITFSFENAIINARILSTMNNFWQKMFLTVGIVIAVFGMRIIFPIIVVVLTAKLPWSNVIELALNEPDKYAHALELAQPSIAAFGGMFLLMLCLHFFFDPSRQVRWINIIERPLQHVGKWWLYAAICLVLLITISAVPFNTHPRQTLLYGFIGIITYLAIHALAELFTDKQEKNENKNTQSVKKAGIAGLTAFLYLEILDASFSFDGVIGAFAVTKDVVLIAIGLGVGALWVRSMTLFMVRKNILQAYRYLEHGAHYTIGVLALLLLVGLFRNIPEVMAGAIGVVIISASIASSVREAKTVKTVVS